MKHALPLLLSCLVAHVALSAETNLTLTVDGITYSNVTFGAVTPTTVTMFHKSGIAPVPLWKLPPELQKRFGYDPQKAATWQKAQQNEAFDRLWTDAIAKKTDPPLREIDGKVYDFSAVIEWAKHGMDFFSAQSKLRSWEEFYARYPQGYPRINPEISVAEDKGAAIFRDGMKKWNKYVVSGNVLQVLPDGVLVQGAFLKHHPDQSSLVDNASVHVLAMPVGIYSYTTTSGARATVKAYDFGTKPVWKEGLQVVPLPPLSE